MSTDPAELWRLLALGYLLSVVMETPVLLVGLSPRHSLARRLLASVWLTACTYPIVVLVLPQLVWRWLGYWPYVVVAEVFAPAAECLLFWLAFWKFPAAQHAGLAGSSRDLGRDMLAIVAANLTSFLGGYWVLEWIG